MKHRTEGNTETTISRDTRADRSEVFELVPSLQVAYVWHAGVHSRCAERHVQRVGCRMGAERLPFALREMTVFAVSRAGLANDIPTISGFLETLASHLRTSAGLSAPARGARKNGCPRASDSGIVPSFGPTTPANPPRAFSSLRFRPGR